MTLPHILLTWGIANEIILLALLPAKPLRQPAQHQHPRAHERDQHDGVSGADDQGGDVHSLFLQGESGNEH